MAILALFGNELQLLRNALLRNPFKSKLMPITICEKGQIAFELLNYYYKNVYDL
jgi:hypothetical protein